MAFVVASLFTSLHSDFHGRKAKEPAGFLGAVSSLVLFALVWLLYWKAGAFSELLK